MSTMVRVGLLVLGVGWLAACAPPPAPEPEATEVVEETAMTAEEALAGTSEAWIEAFNSGDAGAIAARMTVDGMLLPPNSEPVSGREAIAEFWQGFIDTGVSGTLDQEELIAGEDFAVKIGSYELFDTEGTQVDEGKWMEVWARVGDEWQMHRDIWNSNMPVDSAEE